MTAAKIAITLSQEHLERARRAVRLNRASSVSGYIARALDRQAKADSLDDLDRDMIAEHGKPSKEDEQWAKRVLGRRKRASR